MNFHKELQQTFNFFDNHFEKRKLYKLCPEFLELRAHFELLNQDKHFFNISDPTFFVQQIMTGVADEKYSVQWNISQLKAYIKEKNIPSQSFHIDGVFSDRENLDYDKVKYYESTISEIKDIIVVQYLPINTFLVIDGNHRIEIARRRGQKIVRGYGLTSFAHHQSMSNEISKYLYAFHHNLIVLNNLCNNPRFWKLNIDTTLKVNSFYSEKLPNNISFNKFKKLRLLFNI